MRILVVEDNRTLADGLAAVLRVAGYAVDVVHDGISADAVLTTETFDLVVLDLSLPEMDGLDVLRRMRAAATLPRCWSSPLAVRSTNGCAASTSAPTTT
jgi:DNA-binding response OmpR family regulator